MKAFRPRTKEDAEVFEIPGMSNVSATRCKVTSAASAEKRLWSMGKQIMLFMRSHMSAINGTKE